MTQRVYLWRLSTARRIDDCELYGLWRECNSPVRRCGDRPVMRCRQSSGWRIEGPFGGSIEEALTALAELQSQGLFAASPEKRPGRRATTEMGRRDAPELIARFSDPAGNVIGLSQNPINDQFVAAGPAFQSSDFAGHDFAGTDFSGRIRLAIDVASSLLPTVVFENL